MATAVEQLRTQAATSAAIGSPFTGAVCRLLAERLDRSTAFGRCILDWPGEPHRDALALRCTGALNALARRKNAPELTAAYPPAVIEIEALWAAIAAAIRQHDGFLTAYLDSPPQTNEVARSSAILGAALHLAAHVGMPLAIYEIGASAGLNLAFDEYRYDLGNGLTWGAADAPLTIASEWRGAVPPLDAPLEVASRRGCDRNPLDPSNRTDAERLMSYIWPDQTYRVVRTDAALRHAAANGRKLDRLDGASWVEREFAEPQLPGTCRVLLHTIVWQYMPASTQARIEAALARAAAAATDAAPVARFAMEPDAQSPDSSKGAAMTLTTWPGGSSNALGRVDFHGRWVEWAQQSKGGL